MVKLFYTTYISVDLAHHEINCAKVGKGRITACLGIICLFSSASHLLIANIKNGRVHIQNPRLLALISLSSSVCHISDSLH